VWVGALRAQHNAAVDQGVSRPDDGTDVPWVPDPVQVDAHRPRRLAPDLGPRRDGPRPGAEGGARGEQIGLDLGALQPRPSGDQREGGLAAGVQACLQQVLALGEEEALALAVLSLRELADQLQLLVVVRGDHGTKKGACWAPG
jgi:hypothetical protein